jgi:hypothetical protein
VTIGLFFSSTALAQPPAPAKGRTPPSSVAPGKAAGKSAAAPVQRKPDAGKGAAAGEAAAPAADAGPTRKVAPNEILRDSRAEKLLEIDVFPRLGSGTVGPTDIKGLLDMAAEPNAGIDTRLIDRVVDAMVAKLTDHTNIRALIDPPPNQRPTDPATHAIHDATKALLEPLFAAKNNGNKVFLDKYIPVLIKKLEPLLKNNLIPRVQAMIILGQAGTPDAIKIYQEQIKNPNQAMWVKLWALEGIINIEGGRLIARDQIETGKVISDFLDKEDDIPWPAQLRALGALGAMRQGYLPNVPKRAEMAHTAMRLLVDPDAKPEVRAEAARALGLMQITAAVPKYNYALVGHAIGQLAADLGTLIESTFSSNPARARYLAVLLAGQVFEAFDGVQGARGSGLLQADAGTDQEYLRKIYDQIRPVMKAVADLNFAPRGQVPARRKDLLTQVDALRDYLEKNAPRDRHLVQGGIEFRAPAPPVGGLPGQGVPVAGPDGGH